MDHSDADNLPVVMMKRALYVICLMLFSQSAISQQTIQTPVTEKSDAFVTRPAAADVRQVQFKEWLIPWEDTRPRDPDVAPNGVIWLVGQGGDYAARFDPETEQFRRKELPPGTGPHNIIIDRDGTLWIAGNRQAFIGRMNSMSGALKRYALPDETARDPHTLVFSGRDEIWFTTQWGNSAGRFNKQSGHMEMVPMPVDLARPYGIKMDSQGHPWIALLGTNALATIDPVKLESRLIYLPRENARLRRLDVTRDNKVWYGDYAQGYIGMYDPETGEFTEWKTPSEKSFPYAMAIDSLERVWFVETGPQPNLLVGFDPVSGIFFSITPIPNGGGSIRNMVYDPNRNSLWFGTDSNFLTQAILPDGLDDGGF